MLMIEHLSYAVGRPYPVGGFIRRSGRSYLVDSIRWPRSYNELGAVMESARYLASSTNEPVVVISTNLETYICFIV